MSAINDGGPAFPIAMEHIQSIADHTGNTVSEVARRLGTYPGMTLRDWFAGMALQGVISSKGAAVFKANEVTRCELSKYSYWIAEAMLAARDRKEDA